MLSLTRRELQQECRLEKDEMDASLGELKKSTDFDDESQHDDHASPEDLAVSMRKKALNLLQHASFP